MNNSNFRTLTNEEIADCVKLVRINRGWSQEQLASISEVSLRTIQRVENGEGSTIDTRRLIAQAFDAEDIDAFNKATYIPLREEVEDFLEKNQLADAKILESGSELLKIAEHYHHASSFSSSFNMSSDAEEKKSLIAHYFNDYRECHSVYSIEQKRELEKEIQTHINALKNLGVSLVYAKNTVNIGDKNQSGELIQMEAVFMIAFPVGNEPERFIVPNDIDVVC